MAVTIDGTNGITVDTIGTIYPLVRMTAQNSTSGTVIDFTGIPSWAKRLTVLFNGVSTTGVSAYLIQIGTVTSIENTGYVSGVSSIQGTNATAATSSTAGYILQNAAVAASTYSGVVTIHNVSSNIWVSAGMLHANNGLGYFSSGNKTLAGVLTRVRITTVNGTDAFDAGSVNVMYEG